MLLRRPLAVVAAVLGSLFFTPAVRADQIDRVMLESAPEIAKAVRGLGKKTVTVLKFEVKVGKEAPTWSAGVTNTLMAKRLENLLILTNDPKNPLQIVTDAGQSAAALAKSSKSRFTWKDQAGRKQFTKLPPLPLAWDEKTKLQADAFVTGRVIFSPDMKTTEIHLYAFTRDHPEDLKHLGELKDGNSGARGVKIRTDRSILSRAGQSFSVKEKGKSRSFEEIDSLAADDAALRDKNGQLPTGPSDAPVQVQVYFDDTAVSIEPDPASPGEGKLHRTSTGPVNKAYFKLVNTSETESYGVLLAVNGKNTAAFDNDELTSGRPEAEQRLWVLGPKETATVSGFYTDTEKGTYSPFAILPEDESEAKYNEMTSSFRGQISVRIFGKQTTGGMSTSGNEEKLEEKLEDEATSESVGLGNAGSDPRGLRKSRSLADAIQKLQKSTKTDVLKGGKLVADKTAKSKYTKARSLGRGLIIESTTTASSGAIKVVKLEYDPLPLASYEVTYYAPKSGAP